GRSARPDLRDAAPPPDPLPAYRRHLADRHGQLLPFFPRAGNRVLDEVSLEIDVEDLPPALLRSRSSTAALEPTPPDDLRGIRLEDLLRAEIDPEAGSFGRWIVFGEPGSGKSTIVRHLAWSLAVSEDDAAPIPVYVPLASWAGRDVDVFDLADAGAGDE